MESILLERSRSTSISSHSISSVDSASIHSDQFNNNNNNNSNSLTTNNNNNSEVDNELAEAAIALSTLSGFTTSSTSSTSHNPYNQQQSNSSRTTRPDPSRSASITSNESWSQSIEPSNSTGATSPTGYNSSSFQGSNHSELSDQQHQQQQQELLNLQDPKFISRVSQLPLVSGGLEWYERSKASSRVVKYGAGLVESSFSAVSRPLANNLQLNSLDEFACRQLDRLSSSTSNSTPGVSASIDQQAHHQQQQQQYQNERRISIDNNNDQERIGIERGRQNFESNNNLINRRESSSTEGMINGRELISVSNQGSRMDSPSRSIQDQTVVVASRSRWQSVLVEAGGIGAAVSVESLKSLRYCLQWLLYATAHLDHQITILRDFIISLHRHYGIDARADAIASASATAHLVQIKHDVVDTIRKVVEVVSKYAGAALPEQAKKYVRQSILGLPVKWASAVEGNRNERRGSVSSAGTPRPERMEDPRMSNSNGINTETDGETKTDSSIEHQEFVEEPEPIPEMNPILRPTEDAAERVLTFAIESLDMLKSVTQIFGESVEKAEAWIERLRIVGLDRQRQKQAAQSTSNSNSPPPPSFTSSDSIGTKRRRGIPRETEDENIITTTSTSTERLGTDGEETLVRRKKGARNRDLAGPVNTTGMDL